MKHGCDNRVEWEHKVNEVPVNMEKCQINRVTAPASIPYLSYHLLNLAAQGNGFMFLSRRTRTNKTDELEREQAMMIIIIIIMLFSFNNER